MKKRSIFILMLLLAIIFIKTDVYAAQCTNDEKQALVVEAQNIVVQTELRKVTEDEPIDSRSYFYNLVISNINNKFYYEIGINHYDYNSINADGEIRLNDFFIGGGTQAKVLIYGSGNSSCENTLLRTVTLKLPFYNYYSEREECKGLENYAICKQDTNTREVTEEEFLNQIRVAEEKEKNKNTDEEIEEESSIIDNILSFIKENYILLIISIVVFIIIIIVIVKTIKKRKKNKIKIDLGGK